MGVQDMTSDTPTSYDSLLNMEINFLEPGTGVEAGTFLVDARQVAMT